MTVRCRSVFSRFVSINGSNPLWYRTNPNDVYFTYYPQKPIQYIIINAFSLISKLSNDMVMDS